MFYICTQMSQNRTWRVLGALQKNTKDVPEKSEERPWDVPMTNLRIYTGRPTDQLRDVLTSQSFPLGSSKRRPIFAPWGCLTYNVGDFHSIPCCSTHNSSRKSYAGVKDSLWSKHKSYCTYFCKLKNEGNNVPK